MSRRGHRVAAAGFTTYIAEPFVRGLHQSAKKMLVQAPSEREAAQRALNCFKVDRVVVHGPTLLASAYERVGKNLHLYAQNCGDGWMLTEWAHAQEAANE